MDLNSVFKNMPPVTKNLILINLFIYLIQLLLPAGKEAVMQHYLALHFYMSPDFNLAQLFTYMFLHGGFAHVFFNMFALFMFGSQIEYSLGSKRFLFYYISCGIGAALVQMGVFAIMMHKYATMFSPAELESIIAEGNRALARSMDFTDPTLSKINLLANTPTVGASGAIYGVLLAFGMLFPNSIVYLMIPPMPIKAKWLVGGYAVLELLLGISGSADGVAHFCHLGGMIAGLLIIYYWKKNGTFYGRS